MFPSMFLSSYCEEFSQRLGGEHYFILYHFMISLYNDLIFEISRISDFSMSVFLGGGENLNVMCSAHFIEFYDEIKFPAFKSLFS